MKADHRDPEATEDTHWDTTNGARQETNCESSMIVG
jgi:hypothetical protein